jgi:hypothetical protein
MKGHLWMSSKRGDWLKLFESVMWGELRQKQVAEFRGFFLAVNNVCNGTLGEKTLRLLFYMPRMKCLSSVRPLLRIRMTASNDYAWNTVLCTALWLPGGTARDSTS